MNLKSFQRRLPEETRGRLNEHTLKLWHAIHCYVVKHGQIHRFSDDIQSEIKDRLGEWPSDHAIQKALREMCRGGFLESHRLIARYNSYGKAIANFWGLRCRNIGMEPSPGAFCTYTLPGMRPDLSWKPPKRTRRTASGAPGAPGA